MIATVRLGGFKILDNVFRVSAIFPEAGNQSPGELFHIIASEKINMPYLTAVQDGCHWHINLLVEACQGLKTLGLTEEILGLRCERGAGSAVLSVFPHRSNPEITGSLFQTLGEQTLETEGWAQSPSAVSVVLREEVIPQAANALFGPFCFGSYRTPADWRLAQQGKEKLYREVVASYQEQRPKVYALEWQLGQCLVIVKLKRFQLPGLGSALKDFAKKGLPLTFLTSISPGGKGEIGFCFCVPESTACDLEEMVMGLLPEARVNQVSPVALFSMNGPHFGDRYGIISELFAALDRAHVGLFALSCSIASIGGVLRANQIHSAIEAIQRCFVVPSVVKKGPIRPGP